MSISVIEKISFLKDLYEKKDYKASIMEAQSLFQAFNTDNDIRYSNTDLLDVLDILGNSLKLTNQTSKAIEIFNIIIEKLPSFPEGYQGLAEIYVAQEDWDNAIKFTKELLIIDTNHRLKYWWKLENTEGGGEIPFIKRKELLLFEHTSGANKKK